MSDTTTREAVPSDSAWQPGQVGADADAPGLEGDIANLVLCANVSETGWRGKLTDAILRLIGPEPAANPTPQGELPKYDPARFVLVERMTEDQADELVRRRLSLSGKGEEHVIASTKRCLFALGLILPDPTPAEALSAKTGGVVSVGHCELVLAAQKGEVA